MILGIMSYKSPLYVNGIVASFLTSVNLTQDSQGQATQDRVVGMRWEVCGVKELRDIGL